MSTTENKHYIDGKWVIGCGTQFSSRNVVDNTILWQGRSATEDEIDSAYHAANNACTTWACLDFEARAEYIMRFAKHVEEKRDAFIKLISLETGKPHWEASTEVNSVINKVAISIEAHHERLHAQSYTMADTVQAIRYKPHGVVAVLGPFNFPAHLSNGHIIPALLAGNTIIYKPSELTPAVAALIMQCWHKSNIPAGVINCIHGDAITAKALLDKNIQGVYFTGSYATGVQISTQLGNRPEVILALEMGGNNPLVIDDTLHDLDAAVYNTIISSFITAGQRCTCARRVIIPNNDLGNDFIQRLLIATKQLTVGMPLQRPEPFIGPVIGHSHALKHLAAQSALQAAGGIPLLPMTLLQAGSGLLSPGILDMTWVLNPPDEEIFAPLIQIYRYTDFDEAIMLANQTRYGLVAGLFSAEEKRYQQFYRKVRAGLINWNKPTTGAVSTLPFGGVGISGNHRPSGYFAADYCAYPIASLEQPALSAPTQNIPGIKI